jgi:hypothetical protein
MIFGRKWYGGRMKMRMEGGETDRGEEAYVALLANSTRRMRWRYPTR